MQQKKTTLAEYGIAFRESAAKELRGLPLIVVLRVEEAIERLRQMPRPVGVRKLRGHSHTYRVRVGDYRVVYEIFDELYQIIVVKVRHRKDVY